jgi:hypothetical protein
MTEEPPLRKGMRPVEGVVMHNFLYWLIMHHPEITRLQPLPQEDLLQLVQQFENSRLDIKPSPRQDWIGGFEKLFSEGSPQDDYKEARETLRRRK